MLHIGFLNISSHMALISRTAQDSFLSDHLHPIRTGSPWRITQGILNGWLDGGILPLPLALVLAHRQKEISLLVGIKNTGSTIVTPSAFSPTPFQTFPGKRILFSCLGSMEYLLTHRLFSELGLSLNPSAGPGEIIAEEMPCHLIGDALTLLPPGSIGAALLEEPDLSKMMDQKKVTPLMPCHDLWPGYTSSVLVARTTKDPGQGAKLKKIAHHLTTGPPERDPGAPELTPICRAHFLATSRYLKSQRLLAMIDALIK